MLQAELAPMQDDDDVKRLREENGHTNGHFQVHGVTALPAYRDGTMVSARLANIAGPCTICSASHHAQHTEGLTLMSCFVTEAGSIRSSHITPLYLGYVTTSL